MGYDLAVTGGGDLGQGVMFSPEWHGPLPFHTPPLSQSKTRYERHKAVYAALGAASCRLCTRVHIWFHGSGGYQPSAVGWLSLSSIFDFFFC